MNKRNVGVQRENELIREETGTSEIREALSELRSEIADLKKEIADLNERIIRSESRYVVSCQACSTQYDMLAHHYSIGLFDNMVYAKCPNCNKAIPIHGGSAGKVGVTGDETH